jgi:hypothetical protein
MVKPMDFGQQQGTGFQPRQMFDVTSLNLVCATCNAPVTQLPFEPTPKDDGSYGRIYCRDCNRQRKEKFNNGGGRFNNRRAF